MHNKYFLLSFTTVIAFTLSACASVKLTDGGETTVRVKPTLLTIARQPNVIAKELQILARNSSVNMGGDTVSPISRIDDGEQTFAVYRCVP